MDKFGVAFSLAIFCLAVFFAAKLDVLYSSEWFEDVLSRKFTHQLQTLIKHFHLNRTPLNIDQLEPNLSPIPLIPMCTKFPFKAHQLEPYVHVSLMGSVFDVSSNVVNFGVGGTNFNLTGHDRLDYFYHNPEPGRFALNGLTTVQMTEIFRWFQYFASNFPCVGYIPGVFVDPMGEPTAYLNNVRDVWKSIATAQFNLLTVFPNCAEHTKNGQLWVACHSEPSATGETLIRFPRMLSEPSRSATRCVCARKELLEHPWIHPITGCHPDDVTCKLPAGTNLL